MASQAMPVVHLELHTAAPGDATRFLAQLCGWRTEEVRVARRPYLALELGGGLGGGVVECGTQRALWLPYVEVPELAAATELARWAGAEILLEPREGPLGWRSVVATPGAGELALWQPKR